MLIGYVYAFMKAALLFFVLTVSSVNGQPDVAWVIRDRIYLDPETIHQLVDEAGNLHITAGTSGGGDGDIVTMKINGRGQVLWQRQFDGPSRLWDAPASLAIDGAGNILVAGVTTFTAFDRD